MDVTRYRAESEEAVIVIGVDPGYESSALVVWDGRPDPQCPFPITAREMPNEEMAAYLRILKTPTPVATILVIEQIESMGMAVGKTTFETVFWSGRFAEAWFPQRVERVTRRAIKLHICGQSRATDSNIRQALLDRFGPTKEKAIGTKKAQGPLYGITGHKLAALAVALTWADQNANAPDGEIVRPGVVAEW